MENNLDERFGLKKFKKDHLLQYIYYLKGLLYEVSKDDYRAKQYYVNSLTKTNHVNHRIRKSTLLRLFNINQKDFPCFNSPEKVML